MKYCFGQWLDTCYKGYKPCRTCKDLELCKDKFQKECSEV